MSENAYRTLTQDEIEFERMETEIRTEFHRNTELAYARKEGREEGIGIGREEGAVKHVAARAEVFAQTFYQGDGRSILDNVCDSNSGHRYR